MDFGQTWAWMRIAEIVTGVLSIYLGYRLFCDVPPEPSRTLARRLFTNVASGTLLALFGMAILASATGGRQPRGHNPKTTGSTHSLNSPSNHRYGLRERIA